VPRAALEACPTCRAALPDFGGWPAWCAACGWGLEPPDGPPVKRSRVATWWRQRTDAAESAELQRLLADPSLLAKRHPRRTTIYAAALGVHAITLALIAAGAWVMTTDIVTVLKIGAGVVTFGLAAVTAPLHHLRPPRGLEARQAPTTFAVAAEIAEAVGVAPAKRVVATPYGHRSARPTSRRSLEVDVTLWGVLDAPGRIAMLAHELAHGNANDPRRTPLVRTASETLDGWLALLRPDPRSAGRRARRVARAGWVGVAPSTAVSISELLLPVAIAPLYGTVLAIGWALREGATVAGLRAELFTDALAATVASPSGVGDLVDGELAEAGAGDAPPAPLSAVPATERERRRRLAAVTGARRDPMHPTYADRLAMLAALNGRVSTDWPATRRATNVSAANVSAANVSAADLDTVTRELTAT
jgi:hypothetical protein